ncbi:enhancer of mRNA-decapping protein 3 [Uranotaenia lowii]|uniref:enhancer of mRNA-decapping protein 3 n=1 Tax=Uranotaenia lowii TaxID=190385 RepID=UPI00247872EE|nr:enhancer of mRNA-decapping protein 3 [Uranotaenia lowii]
MTDNWVGKSVSIHCQGDIGVFQGVIKQVNPQEITITKVVRNGIPLKNSSMQVTLTSKNITKLDIIECSNVPSLALPVKVVQQQQQQNQIFDDSITNDLEGLKIVNGDSGGNGKLQNPNGSRNKTPINGKQSSKSPGPNKYNNGNQQQQQKNGFEMGSAKSTSRPIEINNSNKTNNSVASSRNDSNQNKKKTRNNNGNGNGSNGNGGYTRYNKNSAFGTPVDDPMMGEDFDFEKNLALFDKQAIWDEIESIQQKPDLVRQTVSSAKKKYRHDENVLASEPPQYRQIELESSVQLAANGQSSQEFLTDDGLVIPSIPRATRNLIQQQAENHGLAMERQNDLLARGASEIALQLLGGSRRLNPANQHQWPKIVVVCDEPYNARLSEVGIATARLLACHGLKVVVYVSCATKSTRTSHELELYAATGNLFTFNANALPSCDLVIAAIKSRQLAEPLRKWLSESRAPVLAVDPPAGGLDSVPVKCSILPIMPLADLGPESATGRLYLCNLGIPDRFFNDSGIKYKSPFDKAVIPIHRRKQ